MNDSTLKLTELGIATDNDRRQYLAEVDELVNDVLSSLRGQFYSEKRNEFNQRGKDLDERGRRIGLPYALSLATGELLRTIYSDLGTNRSPEYLRSQLMILRANEKVSYELRKANL